MKTSVVIGMKFVELIPIVTIHCHDEWWTCSNNTVTSSHESLSHVLGPLCPVSRFDMSSHELPSRSLDVRDTLTQVYIRSVTKHNDARCVL